MGSLAGTCEDKRSMGGCRYGWVEREREIYMYRERERDREREIVYYIRKCIKTVSVRGYPMLVK